MTQIDKNLFAVWIAAFLIAIIIIIYGLTTLPQFSPEQMVKKDMYDYILITIDTTYANMCKLQIISAFC